MKFSTEHYSDLKKAIANSCVDLKATKEAYKEKGLSDTRFIWDIFWASRWSQTDAGRAADYMDTHIQTATKTAINELIFAETAKSLSNIPVEYGKENKAWSEVGYNH